MSNGHEPLRRPAHHFTARRGWINDPLGVTFRDGRADLFYQYVPDVASWRPACHWGHATSTDLLTWEERPPALGPGDGDEGCWSGCVVVADGEVRMLYTSVSLPDLAMGRVRSARPVDGSWDSWAKGRVVAARPDGVDAFAFRDPFVWRDGEQWRMLVGAGLRGGDAAVLTFVSPDLDAWHYDGVFARRSTSERDPVWTGSLWECPQLVSVGDEDFLVVSVWDDEVLHHVACARGTSRGGRFDVAGWQRLTYGPCYYAASSFRDDEGHPGLVHWLRGVGGPPEEWAGALSVLHRLTALDGALVAEPHPRIDALLGDVATSGQRVDGTTRIALPSWHCDLWVDLGRAEGIVHVTLPPAGGSVEPLLSLTLDPREGTLTVTTSDAGWAMPVPSPPAGLRVLLDGCLAEIFAGSAGVLAVPLVVGSAEAAPDVEVRAAPERGAVLTVREMGGGPGQGSASQA